MPFRTNTNINNVPKASTPLFLKGEIRRRQGYGGTGGKRITKPTFGFFSREKKFPSCPAYSFTLIELVVAIAIIAISTTMATAYLRPESPSRTLDNACREFETFCSGVRFRATEEGCEWKVCFDPDENGFVAYRAPEEKLILPDSDEEEEEEVDEVEAAVEAHQERMNVRTIGEAGDEEEEANISNAPPVLRWKLPESVEFTTEEEKEDDLAVSERLEVFRFYADGAGGGGNRLVFSIEELKKTFAVSKLTGQLLVYDGSPEDVDEMLESEENIGGDAPASGEEQR